jgi:hypothetical protein
VILPVIVPRASCAQTTPPANNAGTAMSDKTR